MGKNSMILIISFSMLTFITSLICTLVIINNEDDRTEISSNKVIAANNTYISSSIIYQNSNIVEINNPQPGDYFTKTFVLKNNNSNPLKFNIYWSNINSTWGTANIYGIIHPEEFVYSLSCTNGEKIENTQVPINNENNTIMEKLTLETNKTNTCTITITFIKKDTDQSYNLEKKFYGIYNVKLIQ